MKNEVSTLKSLARIGEVTGGILLVPLIAMQFSDEVDWGVEDFIIAGVFFILLGSILEFGVRKIKDRRRKFLIGLSIIFIFALVWIELAVGIFTNPGS